MSSDSARAGTSGRAVAEIFESPDAWRNSMAPSEWSFFCAPYNCRQVRRWVPSNPGVYCLWVWMEESHWECIYVGKAESLDKRLLNHLSDHEPNDCLCWLLNFLCGFHWMEVPSPADRDGIEKYLYDALSPVCNMSDPGGSPRKVSLPAIPG